MDKMIVGPMPLEPKQGDSLGGVATCLAWRESEVPSPTSSCGTPRSPTTLIRAQECDAMLRRLGGRRMARAAELRREPVSYTHLTLATILLV
eukprot:1289127-Pyramimonas_sp.AAC.1